MPAWAFMPTHPHLREKIPKINDPQKETEVSTPFALDFWRFIEKLDSNVRIPGSDGIRFGVSPILRFSQRGDSST